MMDVLQSVVIVAANAAMPGSGVLVASGFELLKVCVEVAQILSGMGESASSIATQCENIREDVEEFAYVLGLLKQRVGNQDKLSEGLQSTILRFEGDVKEYNRVMAKFKSRTLLKQLIFRKEMDFASVRTMKTTGLLKERLNLECSIAASSHEGVRLLEPQSSVSIEKLDQTRAPAHNEPDEAEASPATENDASAPGPSDQAVVIVASRSPTEELKVREKRYMAQVDSPEITTEMADVETQKEILALLKSIDKHHGDPVVSVIKEKLRSSSSAEVKNEVNSLPSWYLTEDQVEIDDTNTLGFGGDARIYAGVLSKKTPVAVKVFNLKPGNKRSEEKAKLRFIETLKLWRRLRHRSICRFHGACYLTKTPFVVMELCDLGPLDKFLRRDESLRSSIALQLLLQAAQGILKMHCSGVVHGDLKCDNILIQSTGGAGKSATRLAKVCDFDRSFDWSALKTKKTKPQQRLEDMSALAMDVEITGALPWLAPECVQGRLPSPASDVYAFGMTLYQALTGKAPFYHVSSDEVLKKRKLEHKLPRREAKMIAGDVWELIKRTNHAEPFKRPSMQEVMRILKGFVAKAQQQRKKEKQSAANQEVDENLEDQEVEEVATVPERPGDGETATTIEFQVNPSPDILTREALPEISHEIAISIVEGAPAPGTLNGERPADQVRITAEAHQQPLETGLDLDQLSDEDKVEVERSRKKHKIAGVGLFLLLLGGLLAIFFCTQY